MISNIEYIISKIIKKLHLRAIKDSSIDKTSSIGSGSHFVFSKMDRHSFCGYDCTIVNTNIGSFCSIAGNCEIGGASHTVDWVSTSPVFNENRDQIKKKYSYHSYDCTPYTTIIGNDVWIGSRCSIKSGVKIGDGSVVGMGSVVTKDIPPYQIWAGNPAKFIKNRFDENITKKLLEIKWWNFSDEKLTQFAAHIKDPKLFISEIEKA